MYSTKSNGLAAANNQPAKTYTNTTEKLNFATRTGQGKARSTLIAQFAIMGFAVHELADGSYLVSNHSFSYHATNCISLRDFAHWLGVSQ